MSGKHGQLPISGIFYPLLLLQFMNYYDMIGFILPAWLLRDLQKHND